MKKRNPEPVNALRDRRQHLVGKLISRAPGAKRENIEQDLRHIRQLDEVLEMADTVAPQPRSAQKRLPLMIVALVVMGLTLFTMFKRSEEGELALDLMAGRIEGALSTELATELDFHLPALVASVDPLTSVFARGGRIVVGEALELEAADGGTSALSLASLLVPAGSKLVFEANYPRLVITVQPPPELSAIAYLDVSPGDLVIFDEDGLLAQEVAEANGAIRLSCAGLDGEPLSVVLDLASQDSPQLLPIGGLAELDGEPLSMVLDFMSQNSPRTWPMDGLAGLELRDLSFLASLNSSPGQSVRVDSTITGGTCAVAHSGNPPNEFYRSSLLAADAWNGYVSGLSFGPNGLHFEWAGSASRLRGGHPSNPEYLFPVLFQKWFGRSPNAYFSLLMIYASMLPIMAIVRAVLGHLRFSPSLGLDDTE